MIDLTAAVLAGIVVTLLVQWVGMRFPPPKPKPDSLASLALKLMGEIAARRFPHLTKCEAVERYMIEQANSGFYYDDSEREKGKR